MVSGNNIFGAIGHVTLPPEIRHNRGIGICPLDSPGVRFELLEALNGISTLVEGRCASNEKEAVENSGIERDKNPIATGKEWRQG
jgi:hypothetical protein